MRETFEFLGLDIRKSTLEYQPHEIENIKDKLIALHYKYGYGVCLSSKIHCLFHQIYGYNHCTKQDMYDFILRLNNKEFDDYLLLNNIELNINEDILEFLLEVA